MKTPRKMSTSQKSPTMPTHKASTYKQGSAKVGSKNHRY